MCGRARLSSDVSEIKLVFSIPPERTTPNIPANWNAAPTEDLPVVRHDPRAAQRCLAVMRWRLVPFWAKAIKVGFSNVNAKAETIDTKPAFGEAFTRRRCLVPFDCFYEWKKLGKERQPYAMALADRCLMALAGLWESFTWPDGRIERTFCVITTQATGAIGQIHDRVAVVLEKADWPLWLGEVEGDPTSLLHPPAEGVAICGPLLRGPDALRRRRPDSGRPAALQAGGRGGPRLHRLGLFRLRRRLSHNATSFSGFSE